jgi:hypothetical protein
MALSDYLSSDEWDACFYLSVGKHMAANFGESMEKTIKELISRGYIFAGLDEFGNKYRQIPSDNALKVLVLLGNPNNLDVNEIINNGRHFVKIHLPDLINETDEEWEEINV